MGNRKVVLVAAVAGAVAAAGTIGITTASASGDRPPEGARATVHVSPDPATARGQEVSITGNCGGGTGLRSVLGGLPDHPALVDIGVVDPDPAHYRATARVSDQIGSGSGRSWSTAAAKRA